MELRPYQEEAITAFLEDFEKEGQDGSGLLYLATGTGKTVIAAELAKRLGGPILFLVHRDELAEQTISKFAAVWKGVDVGLVKAQHNELGRTVTVASVQTIQNQKRMDQLLAAKDYKLAIGDEAHHFGAKTWENAIKSIKSYRLGLTATPIRSDGVALDHIFSKILYKYSVVDAIKDGYLVDIEGRQIDINMSLDGVKCSAGDFAAMAIADVMCHESVMKIAFDKWKEYAQDRKTAIFCCNVEHSKKVSEYFCREGVAVDWIAGEMDHDTRKATLNRFSKGQSQCIASCMILTEGWDEPAVDCIMNLRPTKSELLYIQSVGRSLRLFPGKRNALILDFVGNSTKHKLMQIGDLTGVPYPKNEKVKSEGGGADRILKSVRDVLVADDKAIDFYRQAPRVFNWIRHEDYLALQMGFAHYLVVRPKESGGYEAVNCFLSGWQYKEQVIFEASIVDICLSVAEEQADRLAKRKDALQFQQADREFKSTVTQKQAELLTRYNKPIPTTAKEAAVMINKLFFGQFLNKVNEPAKIQDRNVIKAAYYRGSLGVKMTLAQIDGLKQIEAEKVIKFYLEGSSFKKHKWA